MNNRVNAVVMVLLMVLSVVASGLGTIPENQNDLDENNSLATQSGGVPCAGDYNLDTNSTHNDSGRGGDVYFSEITGNNVSHFGIVGSNDTLDDYCVVLNPGESIILSSMCASNATDCNNSSIGVQMWSGVFTAWNGSVSWVNLTSSITTLPTYTNNLTTNDTFAFGFTSGDSMFYSYNIWKIGGNSTGGNGSGNNSGGNNTGPMEWLSAWAGGSNFTSNSTIGVNWSAGDLVTNITYNVTLDVYAHNSTTNTTYVIWDDYTVFNATSNASSGVLQIPSGTLPTGCYYASVSLYDNDDGMHFDNDGFDLDVGMDCSGGSGNNSGPVMESVYGAPMSPTNNYTLMWQAFDLVNDTNYNVTIEIWAHNETTNTSYVIYSNNTVFDSSHYSWNSSVQSAYGYWSAHSGATGHAYPSGCYYVSIDLFDDDDGMHFDNHGFDFDVGMDCSGGSGNNTGNASGAFVNAWPTGGNGTISDYEMSSTDANITIGAFDLTNGSQYYLDWQITDLVTGILVDSDVWNWTATDVERVEWYDATNLGQGCYYFEVTLYDYTNSWTFVEYEDWPFTIDMTFVDCNNTGGNNTGGNGTSMVNINWINTTASSGGGDAEISVESSGNWTAYWGITNINSASTFPSWSNTNGWWNASASGGLGTTTGNGDTTWIFQDMDNWGALAPPSCNILMIALFDGNLGTASAQSTPATGYPVSIDFQTFELGNITAADCNWDSSWGGNNTGGNNTGGNNTGGNNTGGNNTGNTTDCGTLDNLTNLLVWTDHTMYDEGDTVEGTFVTNCTVLNKTYTLDYILFDSNNNSVSNNSANPWTWIANNVAESHSMNWTGLTADTYCLWAHLEDALAAQSVDSDTYCFDVTAPSTAWGNGTARFIYIKPLAQNADEHTPFNLTFPAPPMAYNSPYLSNMICSKAVGHSADVWETYVPMPFNNITSWKVENTYGLVMGMFEMNNAQTAGISTMQNPTVIFEQDLSFNGHAPSTVVDQATFNCPMANNTGGNNTGGNNTGNNTVTNTAPQISSVVIAPSSPLETDVLTCTYTYTDAENDPDSSSVTWMINGVPATTSGPTLSTGYVTGDNVICAVFAYDGIDYGNVETTSVVITSNSTGSGSSSGSGLPAIGAVGTLAAIGAGFFAILRREDDE